MHLRARIIAISAAALLTAGRDPPDNPEHRPSEFHPAGGRRIRRKPRQGGHHHRCRWLVHSGAKLQRTTTYSRGRIVAFDETNGAISTTFAPNFNNQVYVVLPGPTAGTVYGAGLFTTLGGASVSNVVLLNVSNGSRVTTFNAGTIPGRVDALRLVNGQLIIGGNFDSIATAGGHDFDKPIEAVLCGTISRWETNDPGQNIQPTWISYSGSDSFLSVLSTGSAVYGGGHPRWMNNVNGNDSAGPGAVARASITARSRLGHAPRLEPRSRTSRSRHRSHARDRKRAGPARTPTTSAPVGSTPASRSPSSRWLAATPWPPTLRPLCQPRCTLQAAVRPSPIAPSTAPLPVRNPWPLHR